MVEWVKHGSFSNNNNTSGVDEYNAWDDATWILTSSFIIFTMQSGFGLLESGIASRKNEANIMVKNAIDVIFGGISYWLLGYGFSFGNSEGTNPFCGFGYFLLDVEEADMGMVYSHFLFQASFATTATTIVSGAMAERCKLEAYILFSFFNTFIFCFPAHWMWANNGWLKQLNAVDIAGDGPVHLVGGTTAFVAAALLKPRIGRFESRTEPEMGCPTNALLGMFMLWWGWLGFNCGSTFGITGGKWKLAARAAVSTILASISGGVTGILLSYITRKRKLIISFLINGILGSLVAITAMCALAKPWECLVIGSVGGAIACFGNKLLTKLKVDDPVSAVPVHCFCAIWGLLAVSIFCRVDSIQEEFSFRDGLIEGGGLYLLGIQTLTIVSIMSWSAITSFIFLKLIDITIGLRCTEEEELLGADIVHHDIMDPDAKRSRAPSKASIIPLERFLVKRSWEDNPLEETLSILQSIPHSNKKPSWEVASQRLSVIHLNDDNGVTLEDLENNYDDTKVNESPKRNIPIDTDETEGNGLRF